MGFLNIGNYGNFGENLNARSQISSLRCFLAFVFICRCRGFMEVASLQPKVLVLWTSLLVLFTS